MNVNFRSQEFWPLGLRMRAMWNLWSTLKTDSLVMGKAVGTFERSLEEYLGSEGSAISVGSGSDAIYLALCALEVGKGSEIIMPANVCVAVVESVIRTGAAIRFVDIRPDTYTLDCDKVKSAINNRTRAILPVHTYGLPADMKEFHLIAKENNLKIVEICGQAFGATLNGRSVGAFGDAACFSFNPSKILGGAGDGGAVFTSDPAVAEKVKRLRDHGRIYIGSDSEYPGISSRLDSFNAYVLLQRLKFVKIDLIMRKQIATYYRMLLPTNVKAQAQPPDRESSHQFFVVETGGDRDQIRSALKVKGIQTKVHYRLPYMMPAYQGSDFLKGTESIPVTEEVAKRIMTLPFHNRFTRREAECVCKVLGEVHK